MLTWAKALVPSPKALQLVQRNSPLDGSCRQLDELKRKEARDSSLIPFNSDPFLQQLSITGAWGFFEVAQKRAALQQERLERQMALERAMVRTLGQWQNL